MSERYVELEGSRIRYIERGSGRPVVLLHGASFNAEVWEKTGTLDAIARAGWRAISVDMPGYGKSEKGSFESVTSFLYRFTEAMNAKEAVVLGASLGGKEALAYAVTYPERVIGLVLIGAVGVWLYEDKLGAISNKPALLIWGSEDTISPPENYRTLQKHIRASELHIIGRIHPCYLEEPEQFNALVTGFLRKLSP